MFKAEKSLLFFIVFGLVTGCGGGGGNDDDNSNSDSTGCINSDVSGGAYFTGSFTGIEGESKVTSFNASNSEAGCGGLGFGEGYSIVFQLPDPGDPNDGDLSFKIDIAADPVPVVASDKPATVLLTLPSSENPSRGGFFNGSDCFVSITSVPEEPDQEGGRLFYPEGTFTCSGFTLDASSEALTGQQPDILISPSNSLVEFLGAVAITSF